VILLALKAHVILRPICRCVDSRRESNGKKKGENNRKNDNRYLAWAFIEAANLAIRHSTKAKRFYLKKAKAESECGQKGTGS